VAGVNSELFGLAIQVVEKQLLNGVQRGSLEFCHGAAEAVLLGDWFACEDWSHLNF
jgi:hypothetical protein